MRSYIRYFANQQTSLTAIAGEIKSLRQNEAPAALRTLQPRHQKANLADEQWKRFLLDYTGDVDGAASAKATETETNIKAWRGITPFEPVDSSGASSPTPSIRRRRHSPFSKPKSRGLEKIVAIDADTARRLIAVTKRIADETAALESLKQKLNNCRGARQRAEGLVIERTQS